MASNNGRASKSRPVVQSGAWKQSPGLQVAENKRHSPIRDSHKKHVVAQLSELFGQILDEEIIISVGDTSGWNVDSAIEMLIEISKDPTIPPATNTTPRKVTASQPRNKIQRQPPSTPPAFKSIKVAYQGYDESPDEADILIEEEEEFEILEKSSADRLPPVSTEVKKIRKCSHSPTLTAIHESLSRGIKILIIMRGVPGSGKSFTARQILTNSLDVDPKQHIFSTDDFFSLSGCYVFDPQRLSDAHDWNRHRVALLMRVGHSPVIIDNTNTQGWEMRPYLHLAVQYGYAIELMEPNTPWQWKEAELAQRNSHGVSREAIRNMLERYEKLTVSLLLNQFNLRYDYNNTPPQRCSNPPNTKNVRAALESNSSRKQAPVQLARLSANTSPARVTPNGQPKVDNDSAYYGPLDMRHIQNTEQYQALPQRIKWNADQNAKLLATDVKPMRRLSPVEVGMENRSEGMEQFLSKLPAELNVQKLVHLDNAAQEPWQSANDVSVELPPSIKSAEEELRKMLGINFLPLSQVEIKVANQLSNQGDSHPEKITEDLNLCAPEDKVHDLKGVIENGIQLIEEKRVEILTGDKTEEELMGTVHIECNLPQTESIEMMAASINDDTISPCWEYSLVTSDNLIVHQKIQDTVDNKSENEVCQLPDKIANKIEITSSNLACPVRPVMETLAEIEKVLQTAPSLSTSIAESSIIEKSKPSVEQPTESNAVEETKDVAASKLNLFSWLFPKKSTDSKPDVDSKLEDNKTLLPWQLYKPQDDATANINSLPSEPANLKNILMEGEISEALDCLQQVPVVEEKIEVTYLEATVEANEATDETVTKQETLLKEDKFNNGISVRTMACLDDGKSSTAVDSTEIDSSMGPVSFMLDSDVFDKNVVGDGSLPPEVCETSDINKTCENVSATCEKRGQITPIDSISLLGDSTEPDSLMEPVSFMLDANIFDKNVIEDGSLALEVCETSDINKTREDVSETSDKQRQITPTDSSNLLVNQDEMLHNDLTSVDLVNNNIETLPADIFPDNGNTNVFDNNGTVNTKENFPGDKLEKEEIVHNSERIEVAESEESIREVSKNIDMDCWAKLNTSIFLDDNSILGSIPTTSEVAPSVKSRDVRDHGTNTRHSDLSPSSEQGLQVLTAHNRSINAGPNVTAVRPLASVFMLDKGSMTSPDYNEPGIHDFELLANMFPKIPRDDLREVFEKCGREINWTVELLLESGYAFEPSEDLEIRFDNTEELQRTQNMLEELNERDLPRIQPEVVRISNEKLPVEVPNFVNVSDFKPSESMAASSISIVQQPTFDVGLPASPSRKSPKKLSKLTLQLKKQFEENFVLSEDSYSEHVLRIKKLRYGESPTSVQVESTVEDNRPDSPKVEQLDEEEEGFVPLTLDADFLKKLQSLFGEIAFPYPEGVSPVVDLPVALARQIHGYVMESQQKQLEMQEAYFDSMIKDEEFARRLQEAEMPPPDLRQIMDMEMALELYRTDTRRKETKEDMATRLSKQKLVELFPHVDREMLFDVFAAHEHSFAATLEVLEASTGEPEEAVRTVMSPEAMLAYEKQLIDKAKLEGSKQSEGHEYAAYSKGATGDNAANRKEVAMDDANHYRNEANRLYQLRNECYQKASSAQRNNQSAVASYYAQVGHLYKQRIEEANSRAAAALLSAQAKRSTTLDLHYLYVAEALEALDIFIDYHITTLADSSRKAQELYVITGSGLHSVDGKPRIRPAVQKRLAQRKIRFHEVNSGLLKVVVTRNLVPSSGAK